MFGIGMIPYPLPGWAAGVLAVTAVRALITHRVERRPIRISTPWRSPGKPSPSPPCTRSARRVSTANLRDLPQHAAHTRDRGRGHILYKQGKIPGSFYTGRGNEASSVGIATAMGVEDVGTPLHRDMGVHVTRGIEPWRIFAQYMGRRTARRAAATATSTWPTRSSASSRWSATCRRCSRSASAALSPSGFGRSAASQSPGSAKAPRRAATHTRG